MAKKGEKSATKKKTGGVNPGEKKAAAAEKPVPPALKPGAEPAPAAAAAKSPKKPRPKPVFAEPANFPVVGIGASAGGLEALRDFFSPLVMPSTIAFVVIMHLDPHHASMLAGLLQSHTVLPVLTIEDGMRLKPGQVYVAPPNRDVTVINNTFQLLESVKTSGLRLPIDFFLQALAAEKGKLSACVILSGTGSDGSLGIRTVKAAGGLALVQDRDSAKYAGMPSSAINTGLADFILPPALMGEQLTHFFSHGRGLHEAADTSLGPDGTLRKICALLRARTGNDFSVYKTSTLQRRVERRMNLHHIDDASLYINFLRNNSVEQDQLFADILIGVTQFFRDAEAFEVLRDVILKNYFTQNPDKKNFRVWVPGCSTGEEVYSIGIILRECLDALNHEVDIQIFGTDLDSRAIDEARSGIFPETIAADVSPERLQRFFVKDGMHYRARKELRETIVFSVQNVLKDPSFSKIDLLCCRNLLIYLNTEAQRMLFPLFHFSLNSQGLLFLGTSESTGVFSDLFTSVSKKWKIYQRVDAAIGTHRHVMHLPVNRQDMDLPELRPELLPDLHGGLADKPGLAALIHTKMLEHFMPACVLVNDRGDIFYIQGRTGRYLEPSQGKPRMNILDMARHGIRLELRKGLRQVSRSGKKMCCPGVRFESEGGARFVDLTLLPLANTGLSTDPIMVVFADVPAPQPPVQQAGESQLLNEKEQYLLSLDQELQHVRENYQTSVEELETSNEELKSLNEELQSANEELQSTNEELEASREEHQSLNEELMTVNGELQSKVDELVLVQSDLKNLLDSTRIATIFVDNELRIKSFTAEAARITNLIKSDVGRPLEHIVTTLDYDDMNQDILQVMASLAGVEKEVRSKGGEWYQMKILPYRTTENVIDGAVLTFVSITYQKAAQQHLAVLNEQLLQARDFAEKVVDTLREAVIVLDEGLRVVSANRAFYRMSGLQAAESIGKVFTQICHRRWDIAELVELLRDTMRTGQIFEDFAVGGMVLNSRRLDSGNDASLQVLLAFEVSMGAAGDHKKTGKTP
ncbi:MAG: PAS domain-containing protein [Proteobacteria bacterium]|nr:PAS domain-containing protein [Pseudomonadota bacterium]MBU4297625.1 PAS domain-containing protein [Pseudomonadota bacterium]MCG2750012.1 PAS domain-containing protein [Desulfobulbaceae bacterium]